MEPWRFPGWSRSNTTCCFFQCRPKCNSAPSHELTWCSPAYAKLVNHMEAVGKVTLDPVLQVGGKNVWENRALAQTSASADKANITTLRSLELFKPTFMPSLCINTADMMTLTKELSAACLGEQSGAVYCNIGVQVYPDPPAVLATPIAKRPWLAWKWDPLTDAKATPNILDAPQDGFWHLSPSGAAYQPDWAQKWVVMLKAMPKGQRGFILRDFNVDVDPSRNPADGHGLWREHGIAGAANKTRHIAQALKMAGISHVDYVLMDFESGMSKSYLDKVNDTDLAAMVNDRRYPLDITALQQRNLTDTYTGTWPSPPAKHATPMEISHGNWDLDCYRWNDLAGVRVAGFLERLAQPFADAWPGVQVSNYGASRAMGTIVPGSNGHPVCRFAVSSSNTRACGAPVMGTDSLNMYGNFGQLAKMGWQNNPNRKVFPSVYSATAPNAFRLVVNRARGATLARQAAAVVGGLHVWVQPKEMVIGKAATPMACPALIGNPSAHCESSTYWEEAILHVALSGVTAFGFWGTPAAGATKYTDIRLQRILTELDGIVGAADRSPHNVTIIDWMPMRALVVSSMSLNQGTTIAHRVVCLEQGSTLSAVEQAGTVKVACGGVDARMFSQSKLANLTSTVSPMGRWVIQTSEPLKLKTDESDTL